MRYAIYSANGRIDVLVSCPEDEVALNAREGQLWLECPPDVSDDSHYVEDGQFVEMPPRPTPFHEFDFGSKTWVDTRTPETQWVAVRAQRNKLLADSDWVVTKAIERNEDPPEPWKVYRQQLRDVTNQPDPFNIVWPTPPTS